jgi:hypothetical protein
MPVRISILAEDDHNHDHDDLRSTLSDASISKAVPFSSVLAERREAAAKLAAAKAGSLRAAKRERGWGSTSADDTASRGTRSSIGSPRCRKGRNPSPRALMRKYRAKVKPRTYLYSVFGLVSNLCTISSHRGKKSILAIH